MKTVLLLIAAAIVAPAALAQPPAVRLAMSDTLREALERSGFEDAIRTENGPDLDRTLTSSAFGSAPDTFVAGYYFKDELVDGQGLGPLHVSLFDRSRRVWTHRPNINAEAEKRGMMAAGSVVGIEIHPRIVLLDTHLGPSAGLALVLDHSLNIVASLFGYGTQIARDGSIWYFGDMPHGDPIQDTLKMYDIGRKAEFEIFPGTKLSSLAEAYSRKIKAIYASHADLQYESDFDRSISSVVERDLTTFAFAVTYGSDYLGNRGITAPTLETIVRCDRQPAGRWSCTEREIHELVKSAGVSESDWRRTNQAVEALVKAALDRKP